MKFYMCVFCAIVCMISLLGLDFFFSTLKCSEQITQKTSLQKHASFLLYVMALKHAHTHTRFSEHVPIPENISINFPLHLL